MCAVDQEKAVVNWKRAVSAPSPLLPASKAETVPEIPEKGKNGLGEGPEKVRERLRNMVWDTLRNSPGGWKTLGKGLGKRSETVWERPENAQTVWEADWKTLRNSPGGWKTLGNGPIKARKRSEMVWERPENVNGLGEAGASGPEGVWS